MGRLKGDIPKKPKTSRGRPKCRDELDLKFYHHANNITHVCKFWKPNPKWQIPEYMVGDGETKGVMCDSFSRCEECGWNPDVLRKRREQIP